MKPVIGPRPVNIPIQQLVPPQNLPYHSAYSPRAYVVQPPPNYLQTVPYPVQHSIPHQPVYSPGYQSIPIQGYMPSYQPYYVHGPPVSTLPHYTTHQPPYYPQYVIPSMPVAPINHQRPQLDFNHNFDYQAANFLTDTKIVENSVFCVICGSNFKASERDEHLKKHMRRSDQTSTALFDFPIKIPQESKVTSKKQYITKPLVQPEEHTILYQPLVYEIVQEVLYQDSAKITVKDEAIGYDPSFSLDPNISIDKGNSMNIPEKMKPEANPFGSKVAQSNNSAYEAGNTLNEPVPFLNYNPIMQNSTNSVNNKMLDSKLSANQSGSSPLIKEERSLLIKEQRSLGQPNSVSAGQSQVNRA